MVEQNVELQSERFKRVVNNIEQKIVELFPQKEEFTQFLQQSIKEGLESLSVIERFGKNQNYLVYANTLEEWDEMIGGEWVNKDSKDQYLSPVVAMNNYLVEIERSINKGYDNIEDFLTQFKNAFNIYYRDIMNDLN